MAQTNKRKTSQAQPTHEGGRGKTRNVFEQLQAMLNAHMLWESSFYVNGKSAAAELKAAVIAATKKDELMTQSIIMQARTQYNIRHASLIAAVEFAKVAEPPFGQDLIFGIIQRADELAEVLAMAGARKAPRAIRKGVARAFNKFDEYQFAKYRGEGKQVSLKDAVFLARPGPKQVKRFDLITKIVEGTLSTPNTWETRMSSGESAKSTFEDLISDNKLGAMALLRNLRKMEEEGVSRLVVRRGFTNANFSKVLPFRFMSAVQEAPGYAGELDIAFRAAVAGSVYLPGKTAVLVDSSGSMQHTLSDKSTVMMVQAGAVLGAAVNGDQVDLYEWASSTRQVPNFQSLSTAMNIRCGNCGHGTELGQAMRYAAKRGDYDRYIVISDLQFSDGGNRYGSYEPKTPGLPDGAKGYMINVGKYAQAGLALGNWTYITGFSQRTLDYIASVESVGEPG